MVLQSMSIIVQICHRVLVLQMHVSAVTLTTGQMMPSLSCPNSSTKHVSAVTLTTGQMMPSCPNSLTACQCRNIDYWTVDAIVS